SCISGPAWRPLRRDHRAVAHRTMVRRCREARSPGDRGGGAGEHGLRAEPVGKDLFRVDAKHPALVHITPALVGASGPRLVWAGWHDLRRGNRRSRASGRREALWPKAASAARRGCARHLVLLCPLALLDPRLARKYPRAEALLSNRCPGDGF